MYTEVVVEEVLLSGGGAALARGSGLAGEAGVATLYANVILSKVTGSADATDGSIVAC